MAVVLKCNNGVVTDTYLNIIADAIKLGLNKNIDYVNNIKDIYKYSKNEIIIVASIIDAYKLIMKRYPNIIMWFQGISPEESFMRHNNKIKYVVLSIIEKLVLKKSKFCFFVSEEMKNHYSKKYNIKFDNNDYYIMPCLNTNINKKAFFEKDKYKNNYFCYAGSMDIWQNFDQIAKCYKNIEKSKLSNCKLFVYTSDKNNALDIINKYDIENYEIDYVDSDKLADKLKIIKYGFIIRDDIAVNRVSTPTKISTYLSCGVIPIYSDCIRDFALLAQKMFFAISYDKQLRKKIYDFDKNVINNEEIFEEYKTIFDNYYNREKHTINISNKIQKKGGKL